MEKRVKKEENISKEMSGKDKYKWEDELGNGYRK